MRRACLSGSPAETRQWGRRLASWLAAGDVVALFGELGAGKTEFVRGVAQGLGTPPEMVSSPTFALVHEYPGRVTVAHVDLYRLEDVRGDFLLDLEEYFFGPYITLVEWAERLGAYLPPERLEVHFAWAGEHHRQLVWEARGTRGETVLAHLARAAPALTPRAAQS